MSAIVWGNGLPHSHDELVAAAAAWLRSRGCGVAPGNCWPHVGERPDAIGWQADGASVLIECKASREDFAADREKRCRAGLGMGRQRYYMCRRGMLPPHIIPAGWGLLWVGERGVRTILPAPARDDWDVLGEFLLLVAVQRGNQQPTLTQM